MLMKALLAIATLSIAVLVFWYSFTSRDPLFSFAGEYHTEIQISDTALITTTNISINFFQHTKAYVVIEGTVNQKGKQSHLYREIWYSYEPVNSKNGLYRLLHVKSQQDSSDTTDARQWDLNLLGLEKEGRLIRLWKLSDKVLLIGNAFSPVLSCTKLD